MQGKIAVKRYIESFIYQDLNKKMVFLGGPRQVGKTTLGKRLCEKYSPVGEYFNWDLQADRRAILANEWREESPLVLFDELHKYPKWKQWIKGVYDVKSPHQQYLVTGSARLDVYRRGGDSLMGRYHYWRLHPFTIDELPVEVSKQEGLERLLTLGGFPEPFLQNDLREANRWRRERFDRIIKEDVRDLERIQNIQLLFLFADALRYRVGSTIALSNLAHDLQISPKTAKQWLSLIERMYMAFSVYPLTKNIPRSIQKPVKVYFYDNADVIDDSGARIENLVATTLLKRLHFLEDYYGHRCRLHYIRDKDNREVDFVTVINDEVIDLIEVKQQSTDISASLKYYQKKLQPKRTTQIVFNLKRGFDSKGIAVRDPIEFFNIPPWEGLL
jgi:uncharacterized protein